MLGRYTTGPGKASRLYRLGSAIANHGLGGAERLDQRFLSQRECEIAARLFENATRAVGGAPKTARQRVRVIQRHQERVDVVHRAEELLAAIYLTTAQRIEQVPPQLAHRLAKPVQKWPGRNSEPSRVGQRLALDQCQGADRLDKLLLRILDVARP